MYTIEQSIDVLRDKQETYQPNDLVQHVLKKISMIALIGPVASGKSSLVSTICDMNHNFTELVSFTTRAPRRGESKRNYRFLEHSQSTLAAIALKTQRGELVQYAVHPTTSHIYGTELGDYSQNGHNITPILSSGAEQLRKVGYGHYKEISIVSSPEDWQMYFDLRKDTMSHDDIANRLAQARQSLEWSLAQPDMQWVTNAVGKQDAAARTIEALVNGNKARTNSKELAATLLEYIVSKGD